MLRLPNNMTYNILGIALLRLCQCCSVNLFGDMEIYILRLEFLL